MLSSDKVRSRGFVNPGQRAAKKIREYAEEIGYDLSQHRSTLVSQEDVDWADMIVYMDNGNLKRLMEKYPNSESKFVCLGNYVNKPKIADPNYTPRGPELDKILESITTASKELGKWILSLL